MQWTDRWLCARVYRPEAHVPHLPKDKGRLVYGGSDEECICNEGKTVATYNTSDLRISIVYQTRRFAHEEEQRPTLANSQK